MDGKVISTDTFTFDEHRNILTAVSDDPRIPDRHYQYAYGVHGEMLEKKSYTEDVLDETIEYLYDDQGRETILAYDKGEKLVEKRIMLYDVNDLPLKEAVYAPCFSTPPGITSGMKSPTMYRSQSL